MERLQELVLRSRAYAIWISDQGAIEAVLRAVETSSDKQGQKAAAAIIRLLADIPALHRRIYSAKAIPILIKLSNSSCLAVAEEAMGGLRSLANGEEYIHEQINDCKGPDTLVKQLRSQTGLEHCAAAALEDLCRHPPLALAAIKAGVLPELYSFASKSPGPLQTPVARILCHMSQHAISRPYLVGKHAIAIILTLLPLEARDEHSPSIQALIALSRGSAAVCDMIVLAGGLHGLLDRDSWVRKHNIFRLLVAFVPEMK